ncbi:ArsR/SmtB family transcription factor [Demequina sp.]|uniref:ArsR/SmtB family transcription factor n=1 Tax=Demequina sp. TaxID=2050685 RepID=UPI003D14E1FA
MYPDESERESDNTNDTNDDYDDEAWFTHQVDRKLAALAHPARRFALELLVWGESPAGELSASIASAFGVATSRGSQHLQVLARAGLVDVYADGHTRNYRLNETGLAEVTEWIGRLRLGRAEDR